jgi:transcriptional antiterminator NusG
MNFKSVNEPDRPSDALHIPAGDPVAEAPSIGQEPEQIETVHGPEATAMAANEAAEPTLVASDVPEAISSATQVQLAAVSPAEPSDEGTQPMSGMAEEVVATEAAADSQAEAPAGAQAEQVSATTDEAGQAPVVAPSAPEAEDEEIVIRPLRKRGKATKTDKSKAPRKSAKKAENLPDPGDGSGYEAPYVPEGVDSPDEPQWYAVHCYSGYENKVKHNLEQRIETMGMADKIFEVVVPTEDEIEVRDGKRRTVERRVFPGYVMVRMKMSEDSWHVVRNTPGVTRFVGMGNRPQPLSPQEVNQILRRMEAEPPKIKVSFRVGQKVRITDGPFADFMGLVDKIDTERAKVTVLVSFFGRETPVELDFLQVEKM